MSPGRFLDVSQIPVWGLALGSYIYIYRERERENINIIALSLSLSLSLYIYMCIYIYPPNKALAEEGFLLALLRNYPCGSGLLVASPLA